jgi:hypothetical protein
MTSHVPDVSQNSSGIVVCRSAHHENNLSYACPAIEEVISQGMDAQWIIAGMDIVLSVFPGDPYSLTSVKIDQHPYAGEVYKMKVQHTRDVGGTTTLNVGVWMPGEGRKSIRASIQQAIALCLDPRDVLNRENKIYTRCPNPAHGLREDRLMKQQLNPKTTYKSICLFNMVLEKMCTECLNNIQGPVNDDYGLPAEAEKW